ncbi:hypothetical protein HHI36_006701 [Cryptolaemus montrouzieri]|uniref:PWWP domain-containing protein n=1 Tax=Cryptolaemus montrouzieri TaxID=559131 RepID=A0ABD2NY57_9CUCU
MPIRRRADPLSVQCVWDALQHMAWYKYPAEPGRVIKQIFKCNGFSIKDWENDIQDVLADKLIQVALRRDEKTVIYKFPTTERPLTDGRDWYCFECHKAGDINFCRNKGCPRVFHKTCTTKSSTEYQIFKNLFSNSDSTVFLKTGLPNRRKSMCLALDGIEIVESSDCDNSNFNSIYDNDLCSICNLANLKDFSLEKSEMNYLLGFVLQRIGSWLPTNITFNMDDSHASHRWYSLSHLSWRASHLFFEHMDMSVINDKLKDEKYTSCHRFLQDILTIRHNVGIFHGLESQEYAATAFILRDTLHDLGEIIGCADCFKHSNEMMNANWFALPCRFPHELVWAKLKGFSYWPAKVIKEGQTHYDVRFFGGEHERALISKEFIKPIARTKESLQVKKSVSLLKAVEELELHQKLLQNPSALKDFIKSSNKLTLPKKQKSRLPSPDKSTSSNAPNISCIIEVDEDVKPTSKKRGRPKSIVKTKKENIPLTDLKKDRESPEIGTEVLDIPIKKRRGRPSTKDLKSSNTSSEVLDNSPKKKEVGSLQKR